MRLQEGVFSGSNDVNLLSVYLLADGRFFIEKRGG
jgi:hypothetical protein